MTPPTRAKVNEHRVAASPAVGFGQETQDRTAATYVVN